jgi:ketosteroid isomerase-like protein
MTRREVKTDVSEEMRAAKDFEGALRSCRGRACTFAFLLAVLLAASVSAQLPPLPTGDKNFPKSLAPVVEAEHAFAAYSIEHGMKEAFLRFAAPGGVVFRRAPVNAIEAWTQTTPAPTGLLTWWPTYADVSRAGDLGYTTGPYEFRENATDKTPAGTGHYFTIWRRQPDGAWKFVLDLGIRHAAPQTAETLLQYPPSLRKNSGEGLYPESALKSLTEAERSLAGESASKGEAHALLSRADETVRAYRQNSFPFVGRAAAGKALEGANEFVTWKTVKVDVASSGDLGYSFGTYEARARPTDEKPSGQGNYARVWKRVGGNWRVVMDVTNPVRP